MANILFHFWTKKVTLKIGIHFEAALIHPPETGKEIKIRKKIANYLAILNIHRHHCLFVIRILTCLS